MEQQPTNEVLITMIVNGDGKILLSMESYTFEEIKYAINMLNEKRQVCRRIMNDNKPKLCKSGKPRRTKPIIKIVENNI